MKLPLGLLLCAVSAALACAPAAAGQNDSSAPIPPPEGRGSGYEAKVTVPVTRVPPGTPTKTTTERRATNVDLDRTAHRTSIASQRR